MTFNSKTAASPFRGMRGKRAEVLLHWGCSSTVLSAHPAPFHPAGNRSQRGSARSFSYGWSTHTAGTARAPRMSVLASMVQGTAAASHAWDALQKHARPPLDGTLYRRRATHFRFPINNGFERLRIARLGRRAASRRTLCRDFARIQERPPIQKSA